MKHLDLKGKIHTEEVKIAIIETRKRRKKEEDKGSFCQKPGCGYQGFELYEIPMGQKTSKYTSKKSDRVVVDIMIKVCRACFKKYNKK